MRAAYDTIYFELKRMIEDGKYPYRTFLPSESTLVRRYGCAHNTVRKALAALAADGYAQPVHGKGVRVIYQTLPDISPGYLPNGIESFHVASKRYGFSARTKVLLMENLVVDDELAKITHFEKGEKLVHLERVRYYNDRPLRRESNYFRADIIENMTAQDAEDSIYRYIEEVENEKLVVCKRYVTVERANNRDFELLDMQEADYVAVLRVIIFDSAGLMCEFSALRHHPEAFSLKQTVIHTRISG